MKIPVFSRASIFVVFLATLLVAGCADKNTQNKGGLNDRALLTQKNQLEDEGRDFEKSGDFESAIRKYQEAIDLDKAIYGSDKGRPLAFLAEVYEKQGRYKEALPIVRSLLEFHPGQENYQDWAEELEAFVNYQDSGNSKFVLDYIASYIKKFQSGLPPVAYDIDATLKITRILAMYDMIGSYDVGINYINQILDYLYKTHPDIKRQKSSSDASELIKKLETEKNNAEAYSYRILKEFLLVREAFEQDQKEGTRGRASKALIQSRYFPW